MIVLRSFESLETLVASLLRVSYADVIYSFEHRLFVRAVWSALCSLLAESNHSLNIRQVLLRLSEKVAKT